MLEIVLVVLWMAWAGLLFGGFVLSRPNYENTRRMPTRTRLASSLVLVIAAAAWFFLIGLMSIFDSGTTNVIPIGIFIGMALGFVGDIFMARGNVIGGMIAFGAGHIAYILSFVDIHNRLSAIASSGFEPRLSLVIGFWLLIGFLGWVFVVWRKQEKRTPLHFAALIYCLLLSTTAGVATALAVTFGGGWWLLALGAALFLLSDLIIAGRMFQKWSFTLIDDVIWLTYGPAQMLIVFVPPLIVLTTLVT